VRDACRPLPGLLPSASVHPPRRDVDACRAL